MVWKTGGRVGKSPFSTGEIFPGRGKTVENLSPGAGQSRRTAQHRQIRKNKLPTAFSTALWKTR